MNISKKLAPHYYFKQSPNQIDEQKTVDSFCDRQVTLLLAHLKHLFLSDNTNVILDFGCGSWGNLFFNLSAQPDLIKQYKVVYLGYDKAALEIANDHYKKYISLFSNSFKQINCVFFNDLNKLRNQIYNQNTKCDIVILKNIMHELELSYFEKYFSFIDDVLRNTGYLIIIDQIRLKHHEPKAIAWHYEDVESFICRFLYYTSLPKFRSVDRILDEYEIDHQRTPFYSLVFQKTKKQRSNDAKAIIKEFAINSQRKRIDFLSTHLTQTNLAKELEGTIYSNELTQIRLQMSKAELIM
ncbi:MAG TPA: hypothetical protein GXX77_01065 [Candidatus Cloacimonetes bacterium]|nr:hypothetical protein [Candidatus Cloacimonadota bacterium]